MTSDVNMQELARQGAVVVLQRIEAEAAAIRRAFPGLKASPNGTGTGFDTPAAPTGRRKWHLSKKVRKAQSIRMKAFWRARRANQQRSAAA